MAVRIGSLFVSLTADTGPFAASMAKMRQATAGATSGINRNIALTQRSVQNLQRTMGQRVSVARLMSASRAFEETADRANLLRSVVLSATGLFGGFAAALSTNIILRYADSYTKLSNQIRVVSEDSTDLRGNLDAISAVAAASRSGLRETGILFSRLQKAAPDIGAEKMLQYVETIQKALQIGGATAQESSSAAIQFAQAIASNRLSGDEIRAILETPLGLHLAKGLGVTIGKLREMGQAGELTATTVLGALANIKENVDKQFSSTVVTVDQSLVVLDNAFTEAIGKMNQTYGITKLLTGGIMGIAGAAPQVISAVTSIGLAFATLFAGKFLGGHKSTATSPGRGIAGFFDNIAIRAEVAALKVTQSANTLKTAQADLQKSILERNRIAGQVSGNPLSFAPASQLSAVKRAQQDIVQLDKQLTESMARRRAIAATMNTTADLQAQAALSRQLVNEQSRSVRLTFERAAAEASVRSLTSGATFAGRTAGLAQLRDATDQTQQLTGVLRNATIAQGQATAAATKMGQAWSLVKAGGSSLLGFLGGPWGLAIASAIGVLEFFGARAAANAQKLANYNRIVDEYLVKQAEAGGAGSAGARETIVSRQIKAVETDLEAASLRLREYRDQVNDILRRPPGAISQSAARSMEKDFAPVRQQILDLVGRLQSGAISTQDFKTQMTELGVGGSEALRVVIGKILDMTAGLREGAQAVSAVTDRLSELQSKGAAGVTISIRMAEDKSMESYNEMIRKNTAPVELDLTRDIKVSKLKAEGKRAEAAAQEIVNREAAKGNQISYDTILPLVKQRLAYEDAAAAAKKGNTELEKTANIIDKIKRESEGAFLGDIDREVIEKTKNIKDAASQIREYIAAVQSGDLLKAPKDLLAVRDALIQSGAADSYREIIQQYGSGAQVAQQFAIKQAQLNYLVAQGKITAEQSAFAWADFVGQFGNFKWIDQVADAVGNLASTSITSFKDLGEAGKNFLQELLKIAVQILLIEPIIRNVRGLLSGGFSGGGGIGGLISGLFGGLFGGGGGVTAGYLGGSTPGVHHTGTSRVGAFPQRTRNVSPMLFRGAPRFHKGLGIGAGEFPAILQQGEKVIPRGMSIGGGPLHFSTTIDARGSNLTEAQFKRLLDERDRNLMKQVVPAVRQAHSRRAI